MDNTALPSLKFTVPWGDSAGGAFIRPVPIPSQIGITNGAASWTDGFTPDTFTPPGSGGYAPDGRDMNGALNPISGWLRWYQAGGAVAWDAAFRTAIGGYPLGAVVASATTQGLWWRSTANNNSTNPDAGGANWVPFPTGYGLVDSEQVEYLSGDFNLTNQAGPVFSYQSLQAVSFTFPAVSPTGNFVLHVNSSVGFSANANGGTVRSLSYGQIRMRVFDSGAGLDIIPAIGHLHVSSDVGAGFDHHQSDYAGNRPAGPNFSLDSFRSPAGPGGPTNTTLRYAPGTTISVSQLVVLANTGSYAIPSGVATGRLVLTAHPG